MAKKWVQFDGKKWVVVGSEGGGGTGHTHPNLTLLNSITQAMVTSWNTAATWVATNGANVLSHIADTVAHITAAERTTWNAKLSDAPIDGNQYARKNGAWAQVQSGGGGSFNGLVYRGSATVKTGTNLEFAVNSGDTAIVLKGVYSSHAYTAIFPLSMFDATATTCAIALSSTYLELKIAVSNGVVTVSRTSTTGYTIEAWSF